MLRTDAICELESTFVPCEFRVKWADDGWELSQARALRRAVFCVEQGVFDVDDVKATACAIFEATGRYHHPAHAGEWCDPELPARVDTLLALLYRGLESHQR